eukprot:jgi/Mesvir1/17527/Mv26493-RA.1
MLHAPARAAVAPTRGAVVAPTVTTVAQVRDPVVSPGGVAAPLRVVPPPGSGGPPSTSILHAALQWWCPALMLPAVLAKLMVDQVRLNAVVGQRSLFTTLHVSRQGDPALCTGTVGCAQLSGCLGPGRWWVRVCRCLRVESCRSPGCQRMLHRCPTLLRLGCTRHDIPAAAATQPQDTDAPPFGMIVLPDRCTRATVWFAGSPTAGRVTTTTASPTPAGRGPTPHPCACRRRTPSSSAAHRALRAFWQRSCSPPCCMGRVPARPTARPGAGQPVWSAGPPARALLFYFWFTAVPPTLAGPRDPAYPSVAGQRGSAS